MSIKIKNLTKVFGEQKAVKNVSFEVQSGEILGFLGPNGAGKSTTMKIATCYLPPTSGEVYVAGYNVEDEPLQVKKRIGYLPEHNPLYTEMYLHEYLRYAGKIYGLKGKELRSRVDEMIEICGLTREQNKKIEALSKGYRQRVGLAQSLIHDPEVLILDEPTTGLDPNQIIEIRSLIKNVSHNKTVVLSTHIMQEVQAICDRVVVINQGEIVANDSIENLLKGSSGYKIRAEFEGNVALEHFKQMDEDIQQVQYEAGIKNVVVIESKSDIRGKITKFAATNDWILIGLQVEKSNLESVFRDLTQNAKADD